MNRPVTGIEIYGLFILMSDMDLIIGSRYIAYMASIGSTRRLRTDIPWIAHGDHTHGDHEYGDHEYGGDGWVPMCMFGYA